VFYSRLIFYLKLFKIVVIKNLIWLKSSNAKACIALEEEDLHISISFLLFYKGKGIAIIVVLAEGGGGWSQFHGLLKRVIIFIFFTF
jgi:hypothetical protein